ncbi:MAG: hydroxymethylglutaryl-CoA reductase, degradative [Flavobacteriaceae bacterium CG_4_8_14_3_um_filter_34_10]|nr:MAG: hydroxymethylglutaryl-CoA reductase, degradative [Flavobacteriaceae bacterium CG2_30_34_30]PIX10666.1 MAG: hydroxymethylglutaryl-CoA reductase, degradative [Flavobacteriaceae bacterium CG_4_8_14_3_um_filter_34_10]PJC07261.1 MAG: hydroxymethylglutaryl-CoA reductase, degradative [Flavobacteriaceae bacterium CG_4_9_14_0_8_um_filter_34_30]
MVKPISGFSKLSKEKKIQWLISTYCQGEDSISKILKSYWNTDTKLQQLHDEFIENTISNFYLPLAIAPNFLINGKIYTLPMAIEESSVVAAASNAAKFWLERGGFKAKVLSTTKNGQVHFNFFGKKKELVLFFNTIKPKLLLSIAAISKNMVNRGGGLLDIVLVDKTKDLENYYQLHCTFETLDAMGANFINSCLEQFAKTLQEEAIYFMPFITSKARLEVVMSILSNYVPECLVRAEVCCPISDLTTKELKGKDFAEKIIRAIAIAKAEPRRAVTHNKGIMNGIDAVVIATGNDFRAVEAGIHAYASKDGRYSSLTHAEIVGDQFHYWIEIPLAIGTVGGLTTLHPLVKVALEILQKPSAKDVMQLIAVAGLAQNFAAIKSLVTIGIQKGHMKMHLMNILNQMQASAIEKKEAIEYFKKNTVTHNAVVTFIENLRK